MRNLLMYSSLVPENKADRRPAKTYRSQRPSMFNVNKKEDSILIELFAPGFEKEDITVTVSDTHLIVEGKKNQSDSSETYLRRGFFIPEFHNAFSMGHDWDIDSAHVSLIQGILKIEVPKKVVSIARHIEIK